MFMYSILNLNVTVIDTLNRIKFHYFYQLQAYLLFLATLTRGLPYGSLLLPRIRLLPLPLPMDSKPLGISYNREIYD